VDQPVRHRFSSSTGSGTESLQISGTILPVTQPLNNVKALKETQSTDPNQWPGLTLFSSTTGVLREGTLLCAGCPAPVP